MDDQIKNAFQKVKQDIDSINHKIILLTQDLHENKEKLSEIDKTIKEFSSKLTQLISKKEENNPTHNPAYNQENPTIPVNNPANNHPFKPQNNQNMTFSTGNEGVPADRQTNQQTNQQTEKASFNNAIEVLNSLDNLKKEIRNKFKRITEQEFLVFSTIYQIEEEFGYADYKSLSQRLNLTESSIRDYVGKLIKKGIPIDKTKINNKMIQLSISEKLKKIAPLPILFQLRSL
jgi:ABC-type Zn2+ transport system substrate-binding protein/surface adhesin